MKIVRTRRYITDLKKLDATESNLEALELEVSTRPEVGALVKGLKGVRKVRFRIGDRGKRGGGRAIYYVMLANDAVIMITAYAKAEKEDLSPDDRKVILEIVEALKR